MNRTIENGSRATVRVWPDIANCSTPASPIPRPSGPTPRAAVTWTREPQRVLDDSNPPFYRWFPDGELNTCYNALDRHVDGGRGDQPALIYDSPGHRTPSARYTYARAARRGRARSPARCAASASARATGSSSTCRWSPRPSIAMLACARLGAVHSVVFGGFAAARARRAHRRRPPEGHRVGVVRHRADRGSSSTSRCSTRRSSSPSTHRPSTCVILQRDAAPRRAAGGPRRRLGRR